MADVFISYKKEDRAYAERIAAAFAAADVSVWWDDDIQPRAAWDSIIQREIEACAAVVVLWSPRAVESDWVRTEAHYGHDRGKLAPAMIEPCEKPIAFMLTQTVDLTAWGGDADDPHWRKLLVWVADLRAAKANPDGVTGPAPRNRFREAIGALASGEPVVDGAFVNLATPAGTVFRDLNDAPAMRIVPRGDFIIGAPPGDPDRANVEGPQKRIEIHRPFALGVYPVTRREYEQVVGATPAPATPAQPARRGWFGALKPQPAVAQSVDPAAALTHVSFDDAVMFAQRLSADTGQLYRLPSETEWEYACRAGSRTRFAWGDAIDAGRAAYRHGAGAPTGPAAPGAHAPNRFGLFDMHGLVREWTLDLWRESYETTPADGAPALDGQASMRVVRGGAWSDPPALLRASARSRATQSIRSEAIGFRLLRVLE
ncbi:MAG TPA: SUMF1/EgtB/PvdO family nonheme iron enzyme [Caulobacteraceae bacterium]|nr:SUMF1/EgtB/PvdO family nonheme iron enzyme [Caulobacteraceae bacterium]